MASCLKGVHGPARGETQVKHGLWDHVKRHGRGRCRVLWEAQECKSGGSIKLDSPGINGFLFKHFKGSVCDKQMILKYSSCESLSSLIHYCITDEERDPVKGRSLSKVTSPAAGEAKTGARAGVWPDMVVRRVVEGWWCYNSGVEEKPKQLSH